MEQTKSYFTNVEDYAVSQEAHHPEAHASCASDVAAAPKGVDVQRRPGMRACNFASRRPMIVRYSSQVTHGRDEWHVLPKLISDLQSLPDSCAYDAPQKGITKMQKQRKLSDRTTTLERLIAAINTLQHSTDEGASDVLDCQRLGEDALE